MVHRRSRITLEERLMLLEQVGVRLRSSITIEHLLLLDERDSYEGERDDHAIAPFEHLLIVMGGEDSELTYVMGDEAEHFVNEFNHRGHGYLSDDIWHFDTECIYDHGDYAEIATRMRDLAHGELPLEEIRDHVDVDQGIAWVAFRLAGQEYRWDAVVNDDWADPDIFSNFAALLAAHSATHRFTYLDLEGQDCLIGCSTLEALIQLRDLTELDFVWLG
jgi:hypothetical protein